MNTPWYTDCGFQVIPIILLSGKQIQVKKCIRRPGISCDARKQGCNEIIIKLRSWGAWVAQWVKDRWLSGLKTLNIFIKKLTTELYLSDFTSQLADTDDSLGWRAECFSFLTSSRGDSDVNFSKSKNSRICDFVVLQQLWSITLLCHSQFCMSPFFFFKKQCAFTQYYAPFNLVLLIFQQWFQTGISQDK